MCLFTFLLVRLDSDFKIEPDNYAVPFDQWPRKYDRLSASLSYSKAGPVYYRYIWDLNKVITVPEYALAPNGGKTLTFKLRWYQWFSMISVDGMTSLKMVDEILRNIASHVSLSVNNEICIQPLIHIWEPPLHR